MDYMQININRLYMYNISILLNKVKIKYLLAISQINNFMKVYFIKYARQLGLKLLYPIFH